MNNGKRRLPRLNHMKISLVTPVYNDPRIGRALQSVWNQRHDYELETIVIDGGSSDETLDVIERYKDYINTLVSEPDRGLYDGMNKGIERATGDVIGILNADDWYVDTNVLRDVIETFEKYSEIGVCYGNILYVHENGKLSRYWVSSAHRRLKWYYGWRPPHSSCFVRKDIYESYGVFNLNLAISSDYELQLRLLLKNKIPAFHLNRVLVAMSLGGISNRSIRNIIKANFEVYRAWRINQLQGGWMVALLKPIRNIKQIFHRLPRNDVQRFQNEFADLAWEEDFPDGSER